MANDPEGSTGRLVLVGTPIGNLADLSPRAAQALREADVVAAEDTRRTATLLRHVDADTPMVAYHDHNEGRMVAALLERVAAGQTVVVVSDAGTPGVADPGFVLVREAARRGIEVEAVPGPVAAIHALVVSGLPTDRFAFEGFLPRKAQARTERLAALADDPRTLIFYVAPHRAADELDAMAAMLGDRMAAVARELTKLHEEVWRGRLAELAQRARAGVRGELTVVVAGASQQAGPAPEPAQLAARVRELVATGLTKKAAIAEVARVTGAPKREVYQAVLDH